MSGERIAPKLTPADVVCSTRRIVVVEGDRHAAEMLHSFLRLMEIESSRVAPDEDPIPTIRRTGAEAVILDLDLPDLRALDLASRIECELPAVRVLFSTSKRRPAPGPVIRKPYVLEEMLRLTELVLNER